ncbi:hypothetical protein [Microbacterium sp. A94]|uniref:hypothetical protein n=1 Tax=Microbacterium sp. A94 TaxID=3450717 RepID=UPI003F42F9DE
MALRFTKKTIIILVSAAVVLVGGGVAATAVVMNQSEPEAETKAIPRVGTKVEFPERPVVVPATNVARAGIDGWTLAERTVVGAVLPEVGNAADGAVSLRVDAPADDADIVAASAPVALVPSTEYTLTASVRVLAEYEQDSGIRLTAGGDQFELPELNAEWQTVEFPFATSSEVGDGTIGIVLSGAVRGFGIDNISISADGGGNLIGNGSFEQVSAPRGILNDSLIVTNTSAVLAVSAAEGEVAWTATSSSGGEPITGSSVVSGPVAALPLEGVPQGHYAVSVRDSSGFEASTNVAVIDSDTFYVEQDSRFGVGAHVEKEPFVGTGTMAAALGFAEVRNDITWERNEKSRGVYAWEDNYVREFARMHVNGVKLLGIVAYGNELYGSKRSPSNEEAIQAYGAYAKAIADTFDVVGLEILNEYNHRDNGTSCGHSPACYVEIAQAARDHVSAAYPDLPLVTGSTALYDSEWFVGFWQAGGMAVTDVVSYHPYEGWIDRNADLIAGTVQQSYADMQEHTGETRPVWVSEMGFPTHYDGVGILEQGEMLVRNETLAFANGVEKYFWYDLVNDKPDPAAGEANFGLYENSPRANVVARAPKPGAFAQALMIAQLGGKEHAATESDETTQVEVFGSDSDATRVAWAPGGETQRAFPSDSALTVTHLSGHTEVLEPVDGNVTITLSGSPVFISSPVEASAD